MIFGNRQQSKSTLNVFFEYAAPKFYENSENPYSISRENLKSAADFFQLPTKLFSKDHPKPRSEYGKMVRWHDGYLTAGRNDYLKSFKEVSIGQMSPMILHGNYNVHTGQHVALLLSTQKERPS